MTNFEKHLALAIVASTVVLLLNIYAVTTGIAEPVYSEINSLLGRH